MATFSFVTGRAGPTSATAPHRRHRRRPPAFWPSSAAVSPRLAPWPTGSSRASAIPAADRLAHRGGPCLLPGTDADLRPFRASRGRRAGRPGRCRPAPAPRLPFRSRCWRGGPDGGGGGGVGPVGVEQHRHAQAELRQHVLARLGQQLFAGRHVAAADEDRGALQVLRAAREDRPMDQVAHLLRLDAAVAEHLVGPGVDGHDAVEDARRAGRCRAG